MTSADVLAWLWIAALVACIGYVLLGDATAMLWEAMWRRLARAEYRRGVVDGYAASAAQMKLAHATGELDGMRKACEQLEEQIEESGAVCCRCQVEKVKARMTLQ